MNALEASDVDDDASALTYSLEGTDESSFQVDSSNGQLKTKAELDFETKTIYQVVIRVTDSGGGTDPSQALTDTVTVDITVTDANDPPAANNDLLTVAEDASATDLDVIANDTDQDGDTLSVTSVGTGEDGPTHGTAVVTSDTTTTVTYTPGPNYHGQDSFTYVVSDGNRGTAIGTVNVTVTSVNDAPAATDDTLTVLEDASATSLNLVANDSDVDGDSLFVSTVDIPSNGTATVKEDSTPEVTYTPNPDFHGQDSFTYTVSDGIGGTDTATVSVTVTPVNDAPSFDAGDGTASRTVAENTVSGTNLGAALEASDVDDDASALTYSLEGTDESSFQVDSSTGQLKTKAELDFETKTTYQVVIRVTDSGGGADSAQALTDTITVDITVTDANDPPAANNDLLTVAEDASATDLDVIANDTDQDGDTLSVSAVGTGVDGPANGTAVVTSGSTTDVSYTPNPDFYGVDSFTYTVSDGSGGTATGTVAVTVRAVSDRRANQPPEFSEGDATTRIIPENTDVGTAVGDPVGARDPDSIRLEYRLRGIDGTSFNVDPLTGQLTNRVLLNHEVKSEYSVRVMVRDSQGTVDRIDVTIFVTNVDEPGTVDLSSERPVEGSELEALLTDPDGDVTGETWMWEVAPSQVAWTAIDGANSDNYTPVAGDVGSYLRATVHYTDGEGPAKSAQAVSNGPVRALPVVQPLSVPDDPLRPQTTLMRDAIVVHPDRETKITSPDGSVTLVFPPLSRPVVFQVRLTVGREDCTSIGVPTHRMYQCSMVEIFDAFGNPEHSVELDRPAIKSFTLGADEVDALGGQSTITRTMEEDMIRVLTRDHPRVPWIGLPTELSFEDAGQISFRVSINDFGYFTLIIDSRLQSIAASTPHPAPAVTPTPRPAPGITPTPRPAPGITPTPTPEPTVTPTSMATPLAATEATATLVPAPTLTSAPTRTPQPTSDLGAAATPRAIPNAALALAPKPPITPGPVSEGAIATTAIPTVEPAWPEPDRRDGGSTWWVIAVLGTAVVMGTVVIIGVRLRRT